jgi:hypothetical protein
MTTLGGARPRIVRNLGTADVCSEGVVVVFPLENRVARTGLAPQTMLMVGGELVIVHSVDIRRAGPAPGIRVTLCAPCRIADGATADVDIVDVRLCDVQGVLSRLST